MFLKSRLTETRTVMWFPCIRTFSAGRALAPVLSTCGASTCLSRLSLDAALTLVPVPIAHQKSATPPPPSSASLGLLLPFSDLPCLPLSAAHSLLSSPWRGQGDQLSQFALRHLLGGGLSELNSGESQETWMVPLQSHTWLFFYNLTPVRIMHRTAMGLSVRPLVFQGMQSREPCFEKHESL